MAGDIISLKIGGDIFTLALMGAGLYEIVSVVSGVKLIDPDPVHDFLKGILFPGPAPPPSGCYLTCTPPKILDSAVCICKDPPVIPPPLPPPPGCTLICTPPLVLNASNCTCVQPPPPTTCNPGYHLDSGQCVPDLYIPPPPVPPIVLPPAPIPPNPAADATTIDGALALAKTRSPGAYVVLQDGIYDLSSIKYLEGANGVVLMPQNINGAQLKGFPLNLKSSGVILQGFELAYNIGSGDYVDMTGAGSRITRCKIHLGNATSTKWVEAIGANCLIDHNEIYGKTSMDNMVTCKSPGLKAVFNYIHDMTGSGTPMEAMRVGESNLSCSDLSAEIGWNRFERISADTELCTWKCVNMNVHHNTMVECNSSHTFRHGHDSKFTDNICINSGGFRFYGANHIVKRNQFIDCNRNQLRGPLVIGGGTVETDPCGVSHANYARVKNCDISENMIISNDKFGYTHLYLGYGNSLMPTGNKIQRNIIVASKSPMTQLGTGASWGANTVSGNVLFPTGTSTPGSMPSSGYSQVDPKIVKLSDGTYGFTVSSPVQWIQTARYLTPAMVGQFAP